LNTSFSITYIISPFHASAKKKSHHTKTYDGIYSIKK
ncbi:MAG: hypothetical protein ACI9Y7_000770, partial [Dokdonia sp.]